MSNKEYSKIICLSFSPVTSRRPMMCHLARNFDLTFNILKANINPRQEGKMILELSGKEEDYHKGVSYLQEQEVNVTPVAQYISRDEESCIHCGVCTAMCSSKALTLDLDTRKVVFNAEKCSACGVCTNICPVHAMQIEVEENGL